MVVMEMVVLTALAAKMERFTKNWDIATGSSWSRLRVGNSLFTLSIRIILIIEQL